MSVLNRLKAVSQRRSLRPIDFLADFDRLHTGKVTSMQFIRALGSTGFTLSPSDSEELIKQFADRDDPNQVQYVKFCDALVDVDAELEKDPRKNPSKFTFERHPVREVDDATQQRIATFISSVQRIVNNRGLRPSEFFSDFDKLKTGYVTEPQFRRCLKNVLGEVPEQVFADLVAKFMFREDDVSGDVAALKDKINYRAFVSDIESGIEDGESAFLFRDDDVIASSSAMRQAKAQQQKNAVGDGQADEPDYEKIADQAVDSIRSQVLRSRVYLRDFFRDWDKRGSGIIPEDRFLRILSKLRIRCSDLEGLALIQKYKKSERKSAHGYDVKYSEFCDAVENILDSDLSLEETRKVAKSVAAYPPLTRQEEARANTILNRVKALLKARRILIMPVFHDFDRTHRMTVTEGHFRRACTTLNLGMSAEELTLLIHKYGVLANDGSPLVQYAEFIAAVDEAEAVDEELRKDALQKKLAAEKHRERAANQHSDEEIIARQRQRNQNADNDNDIDMEKLLAKIQKYTITRRARINTFFPDFDKLRTGAIPTAKFRQAIGMAGLSLSDLEFAALVAKYATDKIPNGVCWVDFANDVAAAETVSGLEKNPTVTVKKSQFEFSPEKDIVGEAGLTTPVLKAAFKHVIERLQKLVYEREIILEQPFRRFDKLNKGNVTTSQFQASLTYLAMVPSPNADEVDSLIKYFTVPDTEFVSYVALAKLAYALYYDEDGNRKLRTYEMGLGHGPESAPLRMRPADLAKEEARKAPITPEDVLERIKGICLSRRISIADLFIDYDRLRSGKIPIGKLATVLASAYINLAGEEIEALVEKYKNPRDPNTLLYKPLVVDVGEV